MLVYRQSKTKNMICPALIITPIDFYMECPLNKNVVFWTVPDPVFASEFYCTSFLSAASS